MILECVLSQAGTKACYASVNSIQTMNDCPVLCFLLFTIHDLFIDRYDPFAADIWATGITLHTLMTGENPFGTPEEILQHDLRLPNWMSKGLRETLLGMLESDCTKRLTAKEIERFPWVRQEVNIEKYNFSSVLKHNSEFTLF